MSQTPATDTPVTDDLRATSRGFFSRLLGSRFASLYLCGLTMLATWTLLRAALLIRSGSAAGADFGGVCGMLVTGLVFDLAACFVLMLPAALLLIFAPDAMVRRRGFQVMGVAAYALALYAIFYEVAVEWFFWDEFSCRFNLIAVEYLKDTEEVLGNIWETYPVVWVSGSLLVLAGAQVYFTASKVRGSYLVPTTFAGRLRGGAIFLAGAALALPAFHMRAARVFANDYANSLGQNGLVCFTRAFVARTAVYSESYLTRPNEKVLADLRVLLAEPNSRYVNEKNPADVTRRIDNGTVDKSRDKNVVVVVVESLSAKFLGTFGNKANLTPNLDALAKEGLLFRRLYATGTRTIRGLEALTICLPPTPGLAVVKRPRANELFSVERLLKARGYTAKFLYGGKGKFDSMSSFLGQDAFEIIDQTKLRKDEVHFTTAWGVCDGDMFGRLLTECDASHKAGKPFFAMAMTVTNHVPFTFPDDKIDMKPGTLESAVKYTDYAIGEMIRQARSKPWFKDTIFLVVADHCARHEAGWKAFKEVTPPRYHIPAILYAPGLVAPGVNETLCSQIDLMPTVLGLMKMSYTTKFFGRDILQSPPNRAFISTPGELAMVVDDKVVVLEPRRSALTLHIGPDGADTTIPNPPDLLDRAITYYQGAGYLLEHRLYQGQ